MSIFGNFLKKKPKSLGEGLKNIKKYFQVIGENLSKIPGQRYYKTSKGNEVTILANTKEFDGVKIDHLLSEETSETPRLFKKVSGELKTLHRHYFKKKMLAGNTEINKDIISEIFTSGDIPISHHIPPFRNAITGKPYEYPYNVRYYTTSYFKVKKLCPAKTGLKI